MKPDLPMSSTVFASEVSSIADANQLNSHSGSDSELREGDIGKTASPSRFWENCYDNK